MGEVTFEYSTAALRDIKAYKRAHDVGCIARIGEIQHEIVVTWPDARTNVDRMAVMKRKGTASIRRRAFSRA